MINESISFILGIYLAQEYGEYMPNVRRSLIEVLKKLSDTGR
jgi:hypothetical protein